MAAAPGPATADRAKPRIRARRQPATYVLGLLLVLIFAALAYVFYSVSLAGPTDLGVRYSESDYQLALAKTGVLVRFQGISDTETAAFLKDNRNNKLMLSGYEITYSNYVQRSFELTPQEATAMANEFLPMFSPFSNVQLAVPANGKLSASFRIYVEKLRQELLPELIGSTRPAILSRLLPSYLNVEISGPAFIIQNSQMVQREQLDVVKVGAVSLRPFIGNTDRSIRDVYTSYAERIYRMVPRLRIQSLRLNERGNFEFSGTLPLLITIRKR